MHPTTRTGSYGQNAVGEQQKECAWVKSLSSVLYYAGVCGQSFAINLANDGFRRSCDIEMPNGDYVNRDSPAIS